MDRISPIIEGRSRTENIKVEIDNKEELLKPGMFIRGMIATYEKKEALVIPSSGLKKKEADYFIFIVHKEEPKKEAEEAPKAAPKPKKGLDLFKMGKKEEPKPEPQAQPQAKPKEKEIEYGQTELRQVKMGYMTQDVVEIDEGLKEDELIIVDIQEEIKDKARVEISEVQEGLF